MMSGLEGLYWKENTSNGACSTYSGWMGSCEGRVG